MHKHPASPLAIKIKQGSGLLESWDWIHWLLHFFFFFKKKNTIDYVSKEILKEVNFLTDVPSKKENK